MKKIFQHAGIIVSLFSCCHQAVAQDGTWAAALHRPDGVIIPFTFEVNTVHQLPVWYIRNGSERIKVDQVSQQQDSFFFQMPVFESRFRLKKNHGSLTGFWIKAGPAKTTLLPFSAYPGSARFPAGAPALKNISGRWAVQFNDVKEANSSVAEFEQKGNALTGTFLNTTGDYRYLEGVVQADSMFLSAFDGSHSFLFTAKINGDTSITGGKFYSGATYIDEWTATKNPAAELATESVAMYLKPGYDSLVFTFENLEGKPVSIRDKRFKGKVVIVQLMGSWCPNCMDETAFLSHYYNHNKQRGVEVIALAYEYTTNKERSVKSLLKFRNRYNVQYSILNTGVAVSDSLRTEKTLPGLTPIRFFPSSVIIDKKGHVRKLDTGFNGPATGEHYLQYKKEFEDTIDALLKEN